MLIIFDWDGTLCDSTGRIVEAMQLAARESDVEEPAGAAVENIIGLGLPEAMQALFPELDDAARTQLRENYSRCYVELDQEPAELFPGAMDTLEQLRSRGHLLAVATGKSRRGLDRVTRGLNMAGYFDGSRCADETRSKPHPLMVQELLQQLLVPATEAVVIGDSEYDLAMARSASVTAVGVSFGVHSVERLAQHQPEAIVDALPELLSLEFIS
ncbi:MAG: HAD-IA family hydrolase [Halieaceae bacterium]